jgi:hypothetical protein
MSLSISGQPYFRLLDENLLTSPFPSSMGELPRLQLLYGFQLTINEQAMGDSLFMFKLSPTALSTSPPLPPHPPSPRNLTRNRLRGSIFFNLGNLRKLDTL